VREALSRSPCSQIGEYDGAGGQAGIAVGLETCLDDGNIGYDESDALGDSSGVLVGVKYVEKVGQASQAVSNAVVLIFPYRDEGR